MRYSSAIATCHCHSRGSIAEKAIMDKIRIAIIGAGETGTPLLRQLLEASFVDVVGLADLRDDQPGVALAKARGVAPQTTS